MDLKPSLQIGSIVKIELWHNLFPYCILSLGLLLLTPLLFGTNELDQAAAAIPLEYFLSLLGLLLLTPIFLPEKEDSVYQVVRSRSTDYCALCLLRLGLGLLFLCLSVFSFTLYLFSCGSQVTVAMALGTIANAIFLGGMGALAYRLFENQTVGYMFPILYYLLNFAGGDKLGHFNLFTMANGDLQSKWWLFAAGLLFFLLSFLAEKRMTRR